MDHDDLHIEPVRGLPEALPDGERILWQGSPSVAALARDALRVRWVAGYFVLLFAWKALVGMAVSDPGPALVQATFWLALGAVACALLWAIAWVQAKATVYTITDARVVMRIGAALTMTVQFPYRWIGAADLMAASDGTGTIALRTLGGTRFSYLVLWPHARPWRLNPTQPALRCIPDAAAVARLLAEAAAAAPDEALAEPPKIAPRPDAVAPAAPGRASRPARAAGPVPDPIPAE